MIFIYNRIIVMDESLIKRIIFEEVERLIKEDVDFQQLQDERDYLYSLYNELMNEPSYNDDNIDAMHISFLTFMEHVIEALDRCIQAQSLDEAQTRTQKPQGQQQTAAQARGYQPRVSSVSRYHGQHWPSKVANSAANTLGKQSKNIGPTDILQAGLRGFAQGYDKGYNSTYDALTKNNANKQQQNQDEQPSGGTQQNQGDEQQQQNFYGQDQQYTLRDLMGQKFYELKMNFYRMMPPEHQQKYMPSILALENLKDYVEQNGNNGQV